MSADLFARILHPAGTARTTTPVPDAPRPRLCHTIGCHDPRNGTCADCGVTLTDDDPVCPESTAFLAGLNGGRGVQ